MDLIRTEETKKNLPILSLNHIFHFILHFSSSFHFFIPFLFPFSFFLFLLSLDLFRFSSPSHLKYKKEKIKQIKHNSNFFQFQVFCNLFNTIMKAKLILYLPNVP